MPLLRILPDLTLEKIERKEFPNEAELHRLIEKNLLYVMGIRLIATEYPIPNGRIDTLGLDEDEIPVIIEYKWKKDLSAIVQGLFYLDWVLQNKKPFESIVRDKLGKEVNVKWLTQPRLLIIAQDFDIKELAAINQMGPRVELMKYSLYVGLFNIENVNIIRSKAVPGVASEVTEEKYTIEELLKKANPEIQALFSKLRDKMLEISDAVWEKVGAFYCDYRTTSTFTTVQLQKQKLRIFIKLGNTKVNDPQNISKPIPATYGYGLLNTQFHISSEDEIEYAMFLIMQAYNYVSE